MGESLGALIVCGTASAAWPDDVAAPSALVLVSPIPEFDHRVGIVRRQALAIAAMTKPMMKRSLASFAVPHDHGWQMTNSSNHIERIGQTSWAVPAYTVRFYHVLSVMVGRMMSMAREIEQPVLVVRAGHDVFASEAAVRKFKEKLKDAELAIYGDSHHLLFYDVDRDKVVRDIARWVGLPNDRACDARVRGAGLFTWRYTWPRPGPATGSGVSCRCSGCENSPCGC
jgi:alpha-beta hydrolase superfamily lysophospholipase